MVRITVPTLIAAVFMLSCTGQEPTEQRTDSRVSALVEAVLPSRLQQLVATLAAFGTRNTLSDTTSLIRASGRRVNGS
jgi:hypothetical protein